MIGQKVIPKDELMRLIKRFLADQNRGISIKLFVEICGISETTFENVFIKEISPMTEITQRRVSKGYLSYSNGEIAVMIKRNKEKYTEYRKEPKLRLVRSNRISLVNGNISLKLGIVNRSDYSRLNIDEQLGGK